MVTSISPMNHAEIQECSFVSGTTYRLCQTRITYLLDCALSVRFPLQDTLKRNPFTGYLAPELRWRYSSERIIRALFVEADQPFSAQIAYLF